MNPSQPVANPGNEVLGDFSISEYVEIIRRRALVMVLVTTGVAVASLVFIKMLPDVYRAETVIMVDPQKVPDSYVPSTVSTSISDRLSTLQQQIMSPSRLKRTIDKLGLYPKLRGRRSDQELIGRMQASTSIELSSAGGGHLSAFKIAFSGDSPVQVAEVANQLAQLFITENEQARERQFSGTAQFLDHQLQDTKAELEKKEIELQRIKSKYVLDLPESKPYHLEALTNLRARLQSSQDQINRAQQDKAVLQALLNNRQTAPETDTATPVPQNSSNASQIEKLEAQLAELRARYSPMHPEFRRVQGQLNALRAKASAEASVPAPNVAQAGTSQKNVQLNTELQRLDREIQQQRQSQMQIQDEIRMHTQKLENIPVFEETMASLMRDHETLQHFYNSLLDKRLSADMAYELENRQVGERFVVLDPASPPAKPFGPKRGLLACASLFAGLGLGFMVAIGRDMLDQSVRTEREASNILGAPVLAGIPEFLTAQQKNWFLMKAAGALVATAGASLVVGLIASQISARWF